MFPADTKILIVDDMKTMRMIISKYLSDVGLRNIREVDDGSTAWAELEKAVMEKQPFNLIISDWNMPQMPGIDLLQKVRKHPLMGPTPFIFVTAETELAQVAEAAKLGVSDYVTKPFTAQTIKDKLEKVYRKVHKSA